MQQKLVEFYSLRNAFTSSHIFLRSAPLGALPLAPLPLPASKSRASSNSRLTSRASSAYADKLSNLSSGSIFNVRT